MEKALEMPPRVLRDGRATKRLQTAWYLALDVIVVLLATFAAYALRFEGRVPAAYASTAFPTAILATAVFTALLMAGRLYAYIWRYVGIDAFIRLGGIVAAGIAGLCALNCGAALVARQPVPYSVIALMGTFTFLGLVGTRSFSRLMLYTASRRQMPEAKPILIVGAGDAGSLLLRDLENNPAIGYRVVGFVDDDPRKVGRRMRTAPVLGTVDDLGAVAKRESVEEVFVATPSAGRGQMRRILYACGKAGLPTKVVPALAAQRRTVRFADLQHVGFEEYLGREPVKTDVERIRASIEDKVVLVTGAAGSIGSELVRQIVALQPRELVMVELDESRLYETYLEVKDLLPGGVTMALTDVRDAGKLRQVFRDHRPQLVIHAAAYKHVPLMELEPDEAVHTNVVGTRNVIAACHEFGTERFLLISTDKAVAPSSVMGLTKHLAERLTFAAARDGLEVTAVRFGNVLGSRGSVIPIFRSSLERGEPVSITDPDVDRYFMTISEAVGLVLQAQAMSTGCDLFILDMGEPVRILDLAQSMIENHDALAEVRFSGLRPAEKLHEVLVATDMRLLPTECNKVMRACAIPLPDARFEERLAELAAAAARHDRPWMEDVLRRLAPDFRPARETAKAVS